MKWLIAFFLYSADKFIRSIFGKPWIHCHAQIIRWKATFSCNLREAFLGLCTETQKTWSRNLQLINIFFSKFSPYFNCRPLFNTRSSLQTSVSTTYWIGSPSTGEILVRHGWRKVVCTTKLFRAEPSF